MSLRACFEEYGGKTINITLVGLSGSINGRLISVGVDWISMATAQSPKQYFDMDKITSFWPDDGVQ